jgi:hypothetical protein
MKEAPKMSSSNESIKIELQGSYELKQRIGILISRSQQLVPLFREISAIMHREV